MFTASMVAVLLALSCCYQLPILFPAFDCAAFIGIHYLVPLAGLALWVFCLTRSKSAPQFQAVMVALPCYAVVLWVHFNIKLWTPHINPATYDAFYWSVDQRLRPIVDICFALRRSLRQVIPYQFNMYMYLFIILFYVSFFFHAIHAPDVFRRLVRTILYLQGLGAIAYLAFPALGPFLYENGVSLPSQASQRYMLDVHAQSVQAGTAWLKANGSEVFVAGLGAMPSLHAAGSFVFFWFAVRHARALLVPYSFAFAYIAVAAIANRWHYLVDLPSGIALASLCIYLAHRSENVSHRLWKGAAGAIADPGLFPWRRYVTGRPRQGEAMPQGIASLGPVPFILEVCIADASSGLA